MARLNHNAFTFTGKLGQVVGCTWKGKPYLRTVPQKSNKPPSPAQLKQQLKFKTVGVFLKPFIPLIGRSFDGYAPGMTGYNGAMQYNYHYALKQNDEGWYIDYPSAALTWGFLQNVEAPQLAAEAEGFIRFSWENSGVGSLKDDIILMLYEPQQKQSLYTIGASKRGDTTAIIDASIFKGNILHAWISCCSPTSGKMARSCYTGQITVE